MENLYLEYRGYTANLEWRFERGINMLHGRPCAPGGDTPVENCYFAGANLEEVKQIFEAQVDSIIERENYKRTQIEWESKNDYLSIAAVLNILPNAFEKRILDGVYDESLNTNVIGWDYEVPLFYVTKAWDVLLKGSLGTQSFMIGPEEDEDFDEEMLREFLAESRAIRTRGNAIKDNDQMKLLWKKYFDIDIDAIDVNFSLFNKHLPPNVSNEDYYLYFQYVPDGINEWILGPVNYPSENDAPHDAVSCLMEYVAEILLFER